MSRYTGMVISTFGTWNLVWDGFTESKFIEHVKIRDKSHMQIVHVHLQFAYGVLDPKLNHKCTPCMNFDPNLYLLNISWPARQPHTRLLLLLISWLVTCTWNRCVVQFRHGVRQLRTGWSDGPAYITQCPIQTGQSYIYNFTLTGQRGTLWWHAHVNWQRATVHGAIVILPKLGVPYPFPKPHKEEIVILGYCKLDLIYVNFHFFMKV